MRALRSSLIEVLGSDYVTTGVAMGLRPVTLLVSYSLRNGLTPFISVLGLNIGWLIGGTIIIEQVFGVPGVGSLLITSILTRDYSIIQFVALVLALLVILVNLLTDLAYAPAGPAGVLSRMNAVVHGRRDAVPALGTGSRRGGWSLRVGLAGISTITALAILRPVDRPVRSHGARAEGGLQPPSLAHWFGTDQLGRDILTRVLYAARTDLQIGTIGVIIPLIMGAVVGLFAGYYAGWPDAILGRVIDVVTAFPFLVLVLAIVAMLGPGPDELLHRDLAGQLGRLRANRPRRGAQRPRPRVHPGRPEPRATATCASCSVTCSRT